MVRGSKNDDDNDDDDDDDDDDESDDGDDVVNEATELDLGTNPRVSQSHFRETERTSLDKPAKSRTDFLEN